MKRLILGAGLAVLAAGCAQDVLNTKPEVRGLEGAAPMQTLNEPQTGISVTLRPGGKATVRLASNPSTGYYWQGELSGNMAAAALISDDYQSDPHPDGMVGVGGTQSFVIEGRAKGKATLTLHYQRSPEDRVETKTLKINVME